MRVCFDVNTLIYLFTNAPQQAEVFFAYDVALARGFDACIPACSLVDINYILHRHGLSGEALDKAMDALYGMFAVFDCTGQDGKRAQANGMADFEDALIAESAARNGIDVVLTYNTKGFRESPVSAMLPSAFTASFKPDNVTYAEVELDGLAHA